MRKLMLLGAALLLSVIVGGCDEKDKERTPAKEKPAKTETKPAERNTKGDEKKSEKPKPAPKSDEGLPSRR